MFPYLQEDMLEFRLSSFSPCDYARDFLLIGMIPIYQESHNYASIWRI